MKRLLCTPHWSYLGRFAVASATLPLAQLGVLHAQQAVPVGAGSYAEFPPAHEDIVGGEDIGMVSNFLNRQLYIHSSKAGEPVPTNDWWTDLIFSQYSGNMWPYPLSVQANASGVNVYFPIEFSASGTDMLTEYPIGVGGQAAIVLGPNDTILADFEGASWPTGWSTTGTAFGSGPAAGSVSGQSLVTNFNGAGLANSFHGGDGSTGVLTSPTFTVNAQYIHALVGGGNHPGAAEVQLVVGGNVVRTMTGVNSENLAWQTWDVSEYNGQSAQVQVVDNVTGGWGHIMADQVVMTNDADPATKFSTDFAPASAVALDWSDWLVQMRLEQNPNAYYDVTMGHGLPFVWVEATGVSPLLNIDASAIFRDAAGNLLTLPYTGSAMSVEVQGRTFGLHAPDGTTFEDANGEMLVNLGSGSYLVISAMPDWGSLSGFDIYAYAIPRDTMMTWSYNPADGFVRTNWTVTAQALKGANTTVLQGWIPHHYRETDNDLTFTSVSYTTPRGKLKLSASNTAQIDFPFTGILPNLPTPSQLGGAHDYSPERMDFYLDQYAQRTDYGGDTYWGGKSLTQFGDYLTISADLGTDHVDALKAALTAALEDWFTYDGVEVEHYFARYDGYKALVGFNESYGSSQFTDHHFHYGYFTRAAALLGLQDPQFLADYGDMAKLVAKQYANWDRNDTDFPFFRTFDLWHGHSYAGGTSAGNGNNQESSSESIQSWCGLFLLGEAMNDNDMLAAGAMGYAIERLAIKEYWVDYHGNPDATNPIPADGGTLPAEYGHELAGIVFDSGPAYATFFSGDPGWMYGIQWLPIQPGLAYMGEDPAFAKSQMNSMIQDRVPTMAGAARGVIRDYNLAPAQTEWHNADTAGALEKFAGAIKLAYDHNPTYTLAQSGNPLYVNGQLSFTVEPDGAITLDPAIWSAGTLANYADLVPPAIGQPLEGWPLYDYLYTNYTYDVNYLEDKWEFEVLNYQSGVDTAQAKKVIGDWGVGLGNVILGYMAHYDADVVAELMDEFYDDGHPIGIGNDTSGLTYYYTHALRSLGHIVYDRYTDIPTSQVFYNPDTGVYSYAVYNPSDVEQTATVYNTSGGVIGTFPVPPKKVVQHKLDQALNNVQITASNAAKTVTPGSTIQFSAVGYDQYGATHPLTSISWSVNAGGSIDANGLFTASTNADPVIVTVNADGQQQTYTFRVGDAPYLADIAITPEFARVEAGSTETFAATGLDQYGDEVSLVGLVWAVDGGGSIDANGVFTSNGTTGAFYVIADNGNASQTALFAVHPPLQNVAAGKTTDASSVVGPAGESALAVDEDGVSRWESAHGNDDEWFQVDLGASYDIERIVIDWEGAYASEYELQVSDDGANWTTILTVEKSTPEDDNHAVEASARYVRFQGIDRALDYGYSFYEFEVYGSEGADAIEGAQLFLNPTGVELLNGMSTDFDAYVFDANWNGGETSQIDWSADTGSVDANGAYTATQEGGPFTVTATFTGTVAGGGALDATATVNVAGGGAYINIAPNGTASASSEEGAGMEASAAIDESLATRWSSIFEDDEYITVDLGQSTYIDSVILRWEGAYGEDYHIQLSDDGANFANAISVTGGDGGEDDLPIGASGRYVRMQGVSRGSPWGYSLWEFEIYAQGTPPPTNLAEGQPVLSSSDEGVYIADAAVDGDGGTRWSSEFEDDEWIYVDLGSTQTISQVVLIWEGAYGLHYKIQVSGDATNWTDLIEVTNGDGGEDDLSVSGSGRYVRMLGIDRGSPWGYSLWEFEVY
ncbi:discoidin domain-containing protein [Cerasicoccus maritimus]|uniref:discoidin domain-containing protein n=1 Tax=Cerasicoccus maritimus TaxID=490089 RepID=UPI0028529C6E|nr:discoidin domain-containing protein [Cerasicoccus maritimus]